MIYNSTVNGKTQEENPKKDHRKHQERIILRIFQAGFNVIPVSGKHPPCIPWKEFQTRRVTPEEIVSWSRGRFAKKDGGGTWSPDLLNFGLLTGIKPYSDTPGIVVVDSDDLEAEELVKSRCPETPVKQQTGKGGWHRVYRRPSTTDYIPNRQKTTFCGKKYNLDIRADGGYILCPGSIHPITGKLYQELDPWTLELIASAPVYNPEWLPDEGAPPLAAPQPPRERPEKASGELDEGLMQTVREYLATKPGSKEGNAASKYCFALAMDLIHGFSLDVEEALPLFLEWGTKPSNQAPDGYYSPWKPEQLTHKLEDASNKESERGEGYLLGVDTSGIEDVIKEVEPVAEAPKQENVVNNHIKPQTKLRHHGIKDVEALPDPTWIVKNHFMDKSLGFIYGPSGHYKSFYALDLACSLATGLPFLGKHPVMQRKVCYLASEGFHSLKLRVKAWREHHNLDDIPGLDIIDGSLNLQEMDDIRLLCKEATEFLGELPVFIIDTVSRNFPGDTKDNLAVQKWCDSVLRVAAGTLVVAVHHTGWDADHERGASNFRDNAYTSIFVSKEGADLKVQCKKQRDADEFEDYYCQVVKIGQSLVLQAFDRQQKKDNELESFINCFPEEAPGLTMNQIKALPFVDLVKWSETTLERRIEEAERGGIHPRLEKTGEGKRGSPYSWFKV